MLSPISAVASPVASRMSRSPWLTAPLSASRFTSAAQVSQSGHVPSYSISRLTGPEKPEPYLQNTLYTKVVLALLMDRPAAELLDTQRAEHLRLMRELTRRKSAGDLAEQLICDHALFHLEADLRWLELTAARLDQLATEVRT